ncbi:MAG: hypothetical protein HOB32_07820 [Nitrospina sp.]|jgi:hypothetical protein|nr:hypothetical protein [Nitrospina sp.]
MQSGNEENNLDPFFSVIDSIEDDISEILEDEDSELSGYECLVVSFNCITLFCRQVGIDFSQIEDHYAESKKNQSYQYFKGSDDGPNLKDYNNIEAFNIALEEIEETLALFEKRCKKTEEVFDEWNCIFISYSCLRKYCDRSKVNYDQIIKDVLSLQSNIEKDEKIGPEDINNQN